MKDFLQNLYNKKRQRMELKNFHKLEDSINSKIGEIQLNHKHFNESLETETHLKEQLQNIQNQNPELNFDDKSTEKIIERKRLKFLKLFGVIVEALLSYNGINLFLKETIGISFAPDSDQALETSDKILLIVKSVILSIPVAYIFLQAAIHFKYNDLIKYKGIEGFKKYWYSLSWILPILVIPFLNIFLVYKHPGHGSNYLWIFFSFLTLLINLKLVNYHSQFNESAKSQKLNELIKPINEELKKENTNRNVIRDKVQKIFNNLMKPAADFRRAYESFGNNKPALSMNPLYMIFMNRYLYNALVLPAEGFTNVQPPADYIPYFNFLDKTVSPRENSPERIAGHNNDSVESTSANDERSENENDYKNEVGNNYLSEDEIFV